ncbi:nitrogen assimilation transcription factor nira [Colletotrichum scovillei]|uniref:nitrogen assimilation transcription factor nira n=1 Tax=Colletotrichum scovillei TaxID=1209932 RepID=UPI0015C343DC|nr:nitrogen assimilation transcription factor nira [Colletotrichum scovillei]KAF4776417.1 nitrogen assimilation transcription factor nira [Colletotrichum scovillei]
MDSIFNNGPYVSKLLLNAIFLQSSPFTDLSIVRTCPEDPSITGMGFYDRFKELLPQHVDNPTMPTVLALVVCGVYLVPYGKQSAGRVYCGMAYRVMVDLGYHLDMPRGIDPERRIYWSACTSDKLQSLYLSCPPGLLYKDGNISKVFLGSYEEMEQWNPGSASISPTTSYKERPAYAISCFQGMLQLAAITSMPDLLHFRSQMREKPSEWTDSLPTHLLFELGEDDTPPPNLVSLQVSYWTLVILLKQAFLNRGHFHFPIEPVSRDDGRRSCIDAAFKIWRLLEAYDTCFTLRHAHYGLLYAAYSAVLVILRHAHQDQEHCIRHTKFFWMILSEYQRKFGRGLRKPFKVLKSLMQQMKEVSRRISLDESSNSNDQHPAGELVYST